VGPYTFLENHHKTNISFNDDSTVDFYQVKTWEFRPEMSNGSLDDEIYTINIIALAAAESTRWPNSVVEGDFPFLRSVNNSITWYQTIDIIQPCGIQPSI
jgi:CD36 family